MPPTTDPKNLPDEFDQQPFRLGEIGVDPAALSILRGDSVVRVEIRVMEVLLTLMRKPGEVLSRSEIEQAVWPGRVVTEDAVTNAIGKLRKALGDNARQPMFIETIAKRGYRLMVEPAIDRPQPAESSASAKVTSAPPPAIRQHWITGVLAMLGLAIAIALWFGNTPNDQLANATAPLPSIAVLPLEALSDDTSQSYFSEGITLDLITDLSRIPGLLVIAHGTASGYRNSNISDQELGDQLSVSYLVRGGVQRSNNRLRINIRLVETQRGSTLWADRFEGTQARVFNIQDQVVARIAAALRDTLNKPLSVPKRGPVTASIAAYDAFLKGQERYGRHTPEDYRAALRYFEEAASIDTGFARAYAGQALAWSRLAVDRWTGDTETSLAKAATLAIKAAQIDPELPQVHFVQAQVELFRGRHEIAAEAASTAIRLNPNYADAHALLAWILHYAGRPDQALPALQEALKRNPGSNASYHETAGEIHFTAARYEDAVKELKIALSRNPAHIRARIWLAASYSKLGQKEHASWEVHELLSIQPEIALSELAPAFPFKDPRQLETLIGSLRGLGLAD